MTDNEMEQLMLSDAQASSGATGNLAGSDAGPSARRAAVGMPPGPQEFKDENLGLRSGPLADDTRHIGSAVSNSADTSQTAWTPPQFAANDAESLATGRPQRPHIGTEMEGDPMAQMVATGAVLGPMAQMIRLIHPAMSGLVGSTAVGAGEGAAASKMMGGDAKGGAAVGAGLGMLGPLARMVTQSRGGMARAVLDEHGAPVSEPQGTFGTPSPSTGTPEIDAARKALQFQMPGTHEAGAAGLGLAMAHLAGHGGQAITPLAIATLLAKNLKPVQGRVLYPLATALEGGAPTGAASVAGQIRNEGR